MCVEDPLSTIFVLFVREKNKKIKCRQWQLHFQQQIEEVEVGVEAEEEGEEEENGDDKSIN